MEFLKGKDLVPYTKTGNLLPLAQVMSIIDRVAEALSYAHKQNMGHRDIKPANIMYEPESDAVKPPILALPVSPIPARPRPAWFWPSVLYVARAVAGFENRGTFRSFLPRRDVVPVGLRQAVVCRGVDGVAHVQDRQRATHGYTRHPPRSACLAGIIHKALAKQVGERYRDGEEMAKVLRACVAAV